MRPILASLVLTLAAEYGVVPATGPAHENLCFRRRRGRAPAKAKADHKDGQPLVAKRILHPGPIRSQSGIPNRSGPGRRS